MPVPLLEEGRWPPIWNLDDLQSAIRSIVDAGPEFDARFYGLTLPTEPRVCQGDIVACSSPMPLIDDEGQPIATEAVVEHWIVISNTCDFVNEDVVWANMSPLVIIDPQPTREELGRLRRYEYSKRFYVPPWPDGDCMHRFADFTRVATIDKRAFRDGLAQVVARMQFPAWTVLHTCLVKYLARDDGRRD